MKVAIVYDRVNKFGGAERFLETILSIFPEAPLFTLVHEPKESHWAAKTKVYATFLNSIQFLRSRHQILSPLAPMAFETLDLSSYDLIISVTSADAKAVLTSPNQVHVCICLTPTRYLWSGYQQYSKDIKMRLLPKVIFNYFRFVDLVTSTRPDHYIAISAAVSDRIKKYYQRPSQIIYPPISSIFFKDKVKESKQDFYLVAGRLVSYKRNDLVIKCVNMLNKKLVVVGTGEEMENLKKMAGDNVTFLGQVSDKELIKLYQQAKALIFAGEEDFGLVPLESQSQGTPVIAYKSGGATETVIEGVTGTFFKKQTIESLGKAINRFEKLKINPADCINNAKNFSEKKFSEQLLKYLGSLKKV